MRAPPEYLEALGTILLYASPADILEARKVLEERCSGEFGQWLATWLSADPGDLEALEELGEVYGETQAEPEAAEEAETLEVPQAPMGDMPDLPTHDPFVMLRIMVGIREGCMLAQVSLLAQREDPDQPWGPDHLARLKRVELALGFAQGAIASMAATKDVSVRKFLEIWLPDAEARADV